MWRHIYYIQKKDTSHRQIDSSDPAASPTTPISNRTTYHNPVVTIVTVDPDDERSRPKAGIVKFYNPDGKKASIRSRASPANSSPEVCFVSSSYARSS
eukprot:scaffold4075_cov63-Cylindrotheca_fusiformis.AAC.2